MDLHGGGKKEKRGIDWWRVMQPHHSIPEIIAHAANNSSKDNVVWKSITRILTPWEMRNTRPNRFRLALETIFREIRTDAFFFYICRNCATVALSFDYSVWFCAWNQVVNRWIRILHEQCINIKFQEWINWFKFYKITSFNLCGWKMINSSCFKIE